MKKEIDISGFQAKRGATMIDCIRQNMQKLYPERRNTYLNEYVLFSTHFDTIPNAIYEFNINCKKLHEWLVEQYKNEIKDCHYMKRYFDGSKAPEYDLIFYFLFNDLLISIDIVGDSVLILFRETSFDSVDKLLLEIRKFKVRRRIQEPRISLIRVTQNGLETKFLRIKKPKLSIEDNYNSDFKDLHHSIVKRLSKKNDKGLLLLHGKPGTGKTSYIRYLISSVRKKVIFLPPSMASEITSPNLISLLIDNPNSIFVIEDAENLLMDRNKSGASPVSALLNITDGLLSDCLNIQLICSFNTNISNVDSALLRKGRLIAIYEFKELEAKKARELAIKLGKNAEINTAMTLTDIYNQEDQAFIPKQRNSIGFKSIGLSEVKERSLA